MSLVELIGVGKRFGDASDSRAPEPLKEIDLRIEAGESVAIVGPSGSGKTTLLQIIGGLLPATTGQVLLEGHDLARLGGDALASLRNEKFGFVFQEHHLLPHLTALENLLVPTLVRHRSTPPELVARARELLAQVGLSDRADHRPAQMSGGECQRVAVARALINDPLLLLADEPTGALDTKTAASLADLLVTLNREQGLTLVTVTHWPVLAARLARTLHLEDGRLIGQESR